MHEPIEDTLKWLQSVVRGYFQYHAIPGNWERLAEFRKNVLLLWHRSLRRRSQRSRWTWTRFRELLVDLIPEVRILHPFPEVRFDAKHPR
jgi:RNA-directed DNA polymerase